MTGGEGFLASRSGVGDVSISTSSTSDNKELTRTNLEVRPKGDVFADLDDITDGGIVQEPLQVEDQNGRERLDELLSGGLKHDARTCGG